MTIKERLPAIREQIAELQTSEAVDGLLEVLDSNKAYSGLLRSVRVIQADLSKLTSQKLKGTIADEDERLASNQINDRLLAILDLVEAGKFTADEDVSGGAFQSGRFGLRQAWRMYLIGAAAVVVLALLGWKLTGRNPITGGDDDCPSYDGNRKWRVMILPFRQTGEVKVGEQALEIAEGLNSLIERTPQMAQAVAIVHEKYDILSKYPTPDEAEEIAKDCGAKMIVWGRINQTDAAGNYKLDVRYRLLQDASNSISGDTTLVNLLKMSDDGQLIRDLDAVTKRLYHVIANRIGVPMEDRAYQPQPIAALAAMSMRLSPKQVDSVIVQLRESLVEGDTSKKTEDTYSTILSLRENDSLALVQRGTLYFKKGHYEQAIKDWERADFDPYTADLNVLKLRMEAYEKVGDFDRAGKDLKAFSDRNPQETAWVQTTHARIEAGREQKVAELTQNTASSSKAGPRAKSTKEIVESAKDLSEAGLFDAAEKQINQIKGSESKKPEVVSVRVEIKERKGDPEGAKKEMRKSGKTYKQIEQYYPGVNALEDKKQ
jgi:tetratricopeptide (TPR) repeat protein